MFSCFTDKAKFVFLYYHFDLFYYFYFCNSSTGYCLLFYSIHNYILSMILDRATVWSNISDSDGTWVERSKRSIPRDIPARTLKDTIRRWQHNNWNTSAIHEFLFSVHLIHDQLTRYVLCNGFVAEYISKNLTYSITEITIACKANDM